MPTCPNCGEIVMNGDPYCPNCGTIFRNPEEDEENIIDDFKYAYNRAKRLYYAKNYITAFSMLLSASRNHKKMSDFEKTQVRANPFREDWVRELCCRTLNLHARYYWDASDFIIEHGMTVQACLDCDFMYPVYIDKCEKCGKPLVKPKRQTPEGVDKALREFFDGSFYSESQIDRMARGSAQFMESNGCVLVDIRDMNYLNLDFIFEKEHRYFTTTYACRFDFEYRGMMTFTEIETKNNYDRLFADESFQKEVRKIENEKGIKFRECVGGFDDLRTFQVDLLYTDDITLTVRFDMDDGRIALYKIDFDSMKLCEYYIMEPIQYDYK